MKNTEKYKQNIKVCGDHGIVEGSDCVCEAGWVGEHCQYKTKCKTNDDCNGDKVTKSMSQWRKAVRLELQVEVK